MATGLWDLFLCTQLAQQEPFMLMFWHHSPVEALLAFKSVVSLQLLREENLDLKLTPYKVLATSSRDGKIFELLMFLHFPSIPSCDFLCCASPGFLQFIESAAIADILATDGSIQSYLRKHMPSESAPYGVAQECMDNYIKSCGECWLVRNPVMAWLWRSGVFFKLNVF